MESSQAAPPVEAPTAAPTAVPGPAIAPRRGSGSPPAPWLQRLAMQAKRANSELWLLLSLFALAWLLNAAATSGRAVLSLYTLPTVMSAYLFGRRHATLMAFGSMLLVVLLIQANPNVLGTSAFESTTLGVWLELAAWGGGLMLTAYLMGTLYEHRNAQLSELRETYHGVLMILRHFVANDTYTENHCYRVSVFAARIATEMGESTAEIEDVRAAALLHDIGKLKVSRDLLYKAARLTQDEFEEMKKHVDHGARLLEPAGGALRRILPIILAHHDRFDGSGYSADAGDGIPRGARIIAVADVFDSMVSDRPYRKAVSSFEAREIIEKGAGKEFDPEVVDAFLRVFRRRELDLPTLVV